MVLTRAAAESVSLGGPDAAGSDQAPSSSIMEQQDLTTPSTNILDLISSDTSKLSQEGKVIVSTIVKAMTMLMKEKDHTIAKLQTRVDSLENKIAKLEDQIDDVEQYERRDTLILSGPVLPNEHIMENAADLVVNALKDNLKINIVHSDINIAHRLGPKRQNKDRPLIVKLQNRTKKSEIMDACVTIRPNLYVNESLTPKRRSLFTSVWAIRKTHRELFQQCYTRDGKIVVKLKSSSQKYIITTEESLNSFLEKYPVLKPTQT